MCRAAKKNESYNRTSALFALTFNSNSQVEVVANSPPITALLLTDFASAKHGNVYGKF